MQFDWFKSLFCFSSQQVQFNTTFFASPVVLVSVHHDYDRKVRNHIPPEYNIITTWIEVRHNSLLHGYLRTSVWCSLFLCLVTQQTQWTRNSLYACSLLTNNAWQLCVMKGHMTFSNFHFSFRKLVWQPWGFASKTWVDLETNMTLCLSALWSLEVCIMHCL